MPASGPVPGIGSFDRLLSRPGDVWHAGLALGMGDVPKLIDFVAPTWMLNRNPDVAIEATSWRLSLGACLARTDALLQLGGVRADFLTIAGAALELGHRLVSRGAFVRHVPTLLGPGASSSSGPLILPLEDELRFVALGFGRRWARWALTRAVLSGTVGAVDAISASRRFADLRALQPLPTYRRTESGGEGAPPTARVTVLIPTVDRYPYLLKLLDQIGKQTIPPHEVIVVDQTAREHRITDLESRFPALPLRVITMDEAGQCRSRNAGLQAATGDYILFLDDDDEIPPELIERHMMNLCRFRCEVSSGVADEVGAGPLPEAFTFVRTSDVFPTNNTLVDREVLVRSGLFDLAFDHGPRADHDLGMRTYLSGALMVLDPAISVLHHHAPQGGLRKHGARVMTYASSRSRLTHRALPSVTEMYLERRYFMPGQVRESVLDYRPRHIRSQRRKAPQDPEAALFHAPSPGYGQDAEGPGSRIGADAVGVSEDPFTSSSTGRPGTIDASPRRLQRVSAGAGRNRDACLFRRKGSRIPWLGSHGPHVPGLCDRG